jgi:Tfp pilus assembly protein PilN
MSGQTGEELEQAADEARARLLDTVVRIEQRGRSALDVSKQVASSARRFSLPVAGLVGVGIAALVVHGITFRKSHRARDRWQLLRTFWRHPDRELRAERRPFVVEVLRSLLLTLATSALAIPLRHAVRAIGDRTGHALAPKSEDGPQNV